MSSHIYNARYKEEIAKYGKKDGVTALCYVVFICVLLALVPLTIAPWLWSMGVPWELIYLVLALIFLAPCFAIILIKRQGFSSIGFHTKKLLPALCLGVAFSALILLFTYGGILPGILTGGQFQPFRIIINLLLITFINAAREDIIMTGYVQPRLYGLVKNDTICVLLGGLLFALIHIPPRIAIFGLSAFNEPFLLLIEIVGWVGLHVVFNLVFRRYFSIISVILVHTFLNFAVWNLWAEPLPPGLNHAISFVLVVGMVGIWAFYLKRKGNKMSAVK